MFGKSADELAIPILVAIFGLLVLAYLIHWLTHRSDYTLYTPEERWPSPRIIQWAKTNGYEIRAHERKFGPGRRGGYGGPFSPHFEGVIYRVVVTNIGEEKRRAAWIRLKTHEWDRTPEDFIVIWEDEWRPPEPPVG